ncbi:hypothetical protein FRX31_002534 [Thalictrum thalictroides]|uniref:Bifunctional inhibitor/plant lipid transfer protein/seed storage helical domain-containing protein n=1 Tax=Thalictrum thalictroides TaxID=46969 RepID=A0A7J6XFM4_THATH|nr:hypothetical protein FRX31_002534 [Thalictrum thalictroides]
MARLTIVGALLLLVLAIAEAKVYQTIIVTTTEFDEPAITSESSERCRKEISGLRMNSCRLHLKPYVRPAIEPCCQELRQVNDPQCRCEALRQTAQSVSGYEQQQEAVMWKAQQLPDVCGMEELRNCQIYQEKY